MAIKVDEEYIQFLKETEGFRANPYIDRYSKKKVLTIGYGETNFDPDLKEITEPEADKMLRSRVKTFEEEINQYITRTDISPEQQRVIMDMAYQYGVPRMVKNGLFKKINNRQDKAVLDVINRFSYATDPDTGKKIQLKGLTKRQDQRRKWWTSKATKENTVENAAFDFDKFESDIAATEITSPAVASIEESEPASEGVSRFNFDSFEAGFSRPQAVDAPAPTVNKNPLAFVAEVSRDEDGLMFENAIKLSKKIGVPVEEAKVLLATGTYEDAVAQKEAEFIDENFKAVATWANNPDNFALIKADPEMAKNVGRASRSFGEDIEIAFKGNEETLSEIAVLDELALGLMPKEEAIRKLEAINAERLKAPSFKYQGQLNKIGKQIKRSITKGAAGFKAMGDAAENIYDKDISQTIPELKKAFKGGAITAGAALDVLRSLVDNPQGTGIIATQSAGSLLAATATGGAGALVGAGAAALINPALIPVGAKYGGYAGSFLGGTTLMFGQYIQQELQDKYTSQDGTVDYRGLIENKAEWSKVRKTAGVYGVVGGGTSVFKFSMLGKFAGKAPKVAAVATGEVAKKATFSGVLRTGVANFVKEGLAQAGGEAMEEGLASSAALLYREGTKGFTPEAVSGIAINSAVEGYISLPLGGGLGLAAGAIKKAWSSIQSKPDVAKASKTVDIVNKASKALRNGDKLTQLRQAIEDSPASKKYKNKTEDMAQSAVDAQRTKKPDVAQDLESDSPVDNDSDSVNEQNYRSILDDKTSVTVNAKQIQNIIKLRGEDAGSFIAKFGPEVQADYEAAIESGGTFDVPVASWIMNTDQMSELDAIVRLDGSEYNAMEGEIILNEFGKNPFILFEEVGSDTPPIMPEDTLPPVMPEDTLPPVMPEDTLPPVMQGEQPPVIPGVASIAPEAEINSPTNIIQDESRRDPGNPVLREVMVYDRFRTNNEREVFKKINSQVKSAVRNLKGISEQEAEIVAELQFRRLRQRANSLGRDIKELADESFIREKTEAENIARPDARGVFRATPGKDISWFIALRKDAKINTVVHELGHAWLYEMGLDWEYIHSIEQDRLTFDQAEYKFAMDEMAKRFGLKDLKKMSDLSPENAAFEPERDRIQETFAKTTEMYILEGKFADSRIRKVLETFRKFFTAIADDVAKSYPNIPPLAISPKMERVFSALLGVSNKEAEILYPMFSTPAFDPAILGPKSEAYLSSMKDAQDSSIVDFYSKAYRRTLKEQDDLVNKFLDQAYDQATEQVDAMASMQVRKDFIDSGLKISFESFVETAFKGDVEAASLAKSKLENIFVSGKKKGGESMPSIMSLYQIGDPRVLIDLMTEASNRDQIIDRMANNIVEETAPLIKSDQELHDIAVAAIQNEPKARFLRKELKHMLKEAQSQLIGLGKRVAYSPAKLARAMEPGVIEAAATEIVKSARAKGLKSESFRVEADRLGDTAADKYSKGDFVGAFEDKQKQIEFFEAYQISGAAIKQIGKTLSTMKNIMKRGDKVLAKKYDMDIVNYIRQVISMFDHGYKNYPKLDVKGFTNESAILPSSVKLINDAISDYVRIMEGKSVTDTTVEAFGQLSTAITAAVTLARHARSVELGLRSNITSEIAADIVASLGPKKKSDRKTPLNPYLKTTLTPRAVLASMFSSDVEFTKSPLSAIYDRGASASARFSEKFEGEKKNIIAALKKIARKEKGIAAILNPVIREIPSAYTSNFGSKKIVSPELGVTFDDMSQVEMLMLYMGSESGKQKALLGGYKGVKLGEYDFVTGKVDDSKVMRFIERLISEGEITKDHMDALEVIWKAFANHHDQAKETYRHVYGTDMGTIKALPFVTSLGTFSGGYIRIEGQGKSFDAKKGNPFEVDDSGKYLPTFHPATDTGMGDTRTDALYELNFDLGRVTATLQNHMKMAYLVKDIYDISKILGRPDVMEALDNRTPQVVFDIILPWFDRIMSQQYSTESDDIANIVARKIRANMYTKLFLGNLKTVLKQPLGLFPAAYAFGAKNVAAELFLTTKNFAATKAEIEAMSIRMKDRFKNNQANLMKSYEELDRNTGWVITTREWSKKYSTLFIQMAQSYVDVIVWKSAYKKGVKSGLNNEEAIRFASDGVERTQSSTSIATSPKIATSSDAIKLFTMIQSVPTAMFSEIYTSYSQNQEEPTLKRARVFLSMAVMLSVLPSLLSALLDEADYDSPEERDDDEENDDEPLKRVALNTASDVLNNHLPVVGGFIAGAISKGDFSFGPIQGFVSDAEKTRKAIGHIGNDVTLNASEVSAMMNFFTSITGLGVSFVGKYVKWNPEETYVKIPFLRGESIDAEEERKELRREQLQEARELELE